VLTRRTDPDGIAARYGRGADQVRALFPRHRETLRRLRDGRVAPGLDRKIVTSWNGLVLASLAQATAATGDPRYLDAAARAATHLLEIHRRPDGSLWRTSVDGRTAGEGVLDDYAFLAAGLLAMHQVAPEPRWLVAARDLIDHARSAFAREGGGWYLATGDGATPLGRTLECFDSVEPSGNGVMLNALLDLAALTGESAYRDEARATLTAYAGLLARGGPELAWWFEAAGKLLWPHLDVVIAGAPGAAETEILRQAFLRRLPPGAVLTTLPAGGAAPELLASAPALAGKRAPEGRAIAWVCEFGVCRAPTADPTDLVAQVFAQWEK
jgi:uncharacterized protein YyaL (SSP411 family)